MKINYENTALILIDIINTFQFPDGNHLHKHTLEIVPHLKKLKRFATENEIPTIYVNDHYDLWTSDSKKIIKHCYNDKSKQIIDDLQPTENDYFLIKPFHSAFHQTPLRALLEALDRRNLILAGIAGDICILFTAQETYMHSEFTMWIPKNCIASETIAGNEHALALMQSVTKADIDPI